MKSQTNHEVVDKWAWISVVIVSAIAASEPEGPAADGAAVEAGAREVADEPREGAAAAVVVPGPGLFVSGVVRFHGSNVYIRLNQGCQMAKFDHFLSLDCARVEGVGAQS